MIIPARSKLLFIGDSVTDCDRGRPVGEGLFDPLGRGYVAATANLLGATYPDRPLRVVNMGCSGHTIRDLAARWQTDVLDQKPDWVVLMIGINDVWRQFDLPLFPEKAVLPDEYEQTLERLIVATKPSVKGLVLMTPFYIEPDPKDAMRARMDQYGQLVLAAAKRHGLPAVDTQAAFNRVLQHQHSSNISWDRVHPNGIGHLVLARAFLDVIGFVWSPVQRDR